ncbi:hypothetical protein KSF_108800 [Reticulibacter mediterranei]|uniref:Uncharacterized protein n=1 Tax=Reticulibacter mediterranei TaxID=2778369 RepID=A0A8J3NAW5_9CHLR|nr:hypothetical protein KSF_108800 [Reticulibacter mediterranei]
MQPFTLHLNDKATVEVLQSQASFCGMYKDHYICVNPLSHYILLPNQTQVLNFGGMAIYTVSSQDAGHVIDLFLHTKSQKKASPTQSRTPSRRAARTTRRKTR